MALPNTARGCRREFRSPRSPRTPENPPTAFSKALSSCRDSPFATARPTRMPPLRSRSNSPREASDPFRVFRHVRILRIEHSGAMHHACPAFASFVTRTRLRAAKAVSVALSPITAANTWDFCASSPFSWLQFCLHRFSRRLTRSPGPPPANRSVRQSASVPRASAHTAAPRPGYPPGNSHAPVPR